MHFMSQAISKSLWFYLLYKWRMKMNEELIITQIVLPILMHWEDIYGIKNFV